MMKKLYVSLLLLSVILIGLGVGSFFILQKGKPYIHQKLISLTQELKENQNINLQWGSISVNSILVVHIHNIEINQTLLEHPIRIKKASIGLSFLRSLIRRQWTFNVHISESKGTFLFNNKKQSTLFQIEDILSNIPIYKMSFDQIALKVTVADQVILMKEMQGYLQNSIDSLYTNIQAFVSTQDQSFQIKSLASLDDSTLDIEHLLIQNSKTSLNISGEVQGSLSNIKKIHLKSKGYVDLENTHQLLKPWIWTPPSALQGALDLDTDISYSKIQGWTGPFTLNVKNLKYENFAAAVLKSKGFLKKKNLHLQLVHLDNGEDWTTYFENTIIRFDSKLSFTLNNFSNVYNFNKIEKLVQIDFPIDFKGLTHFKCHGQIRDPYLECDTSSTLEQVFVSLEKSESNLIEIPRLSLTSQFQWKSDIFKITSKLMTQNNSILDIKTLIDVKNQMNISLSGDINLASVDRFLEKRIKGYLHIPQSTIVFRDRDDWDLNGNMRLSKLFIDDIELDFLKAKVTADNDLALFQNVQGRLKESRYKGEFALYFKKNLALNTSLQFLPLYLSDLQLNSIFSAYVKVSGKGSSKLSAQIRWLNKNPKFNFQLQSQFENVKIHQESFRNLEVNISAKNNRIVIQKAVAKKIKGQVIAKGFIDKKKIAQILLTGKDLLIERSELISPWLNPDIKGVIAFTQMIQGPLQNLKSKINLSIVKSFFGTMPLKNSSAILNYSKNKLQVQGQFFKDQIILKNLNISSKPKKELSLDMRVNNLNFIPLFKTSSSTEVISSYLTGSASLKIPLSNWKGLSGDIHINKLKIKNRTNLIVLKNSHSLSIKKGRLTLKEDRLDLTNMNKNLWVKKLKNNAYTLSGALDLDLLSIFSKNIKSTQGELSFHINFNNTLDHLRPIGKLNIRKGSIDTYNYFDPFTAVNLESEITARRYVIKELRAQSKEGSLSASGYVDLSHPHQLPINIQAQFNKISMKFADGVGASGNGNIKFSGVSRPYKLLGTIDVNDGYFNKDEKSNSKPASYKRDLLSEESEKSLFNWDLKIQSGRAILIENPIISAEVEGALHMTGPGTSPLLTGSLNFLPGGRVRIREYDLTIQLGRVFYDKSRPNQAQINFAAETEFTENKFINDREDSTKYAIKVEALGYMSEPQLSFSSQPALSEPEILSMMALGVRSSDSIDGEALDSIAKYSYSQIGLALFQNFIGSEIQDKLGIKVAAIPYINIRKNKPSTRIWMNKEWTEHLSTSLTTALEDIDRSFAIKYDFTPKLSLLGIWKNEKPENERNSNTLGLDVEYKVRF